MKTLNLIILLVVVNYTNAQKLTPEEYAAKAKYVWQNFVPESGQAEFVQGELLRALEKLRDEAQRNGNGNFNKNCHGKLVRYLRQKLADSKLFNAMQVKQIKYDLNQLNYERRPYLGDDLYDGISDRIVDWYLFYGEDVIHENNPDLQC
ncbi:MAG: hypothetical protein WBB27_03445 [Maribacter sp.]